MSNLFKKVACFTDLHLGHKHNSKEHNEDCIDYLKWFINEAKQRGCETCICLGDFHHHRNSINVSTMNYSLAALRLLNENFDDTYMIVGNHDNFYRANRDITSLALGKEFNNITIIDDIFIKGDVALCPWLVDDEWKAVKEIKTKYMFGHFEIPGFKMNAQIDMPDHGQIQKTHFKNQDYVFSGHFHKRQAQGNIHYIGNCFPHNHSDDGDSERGAMFLDWGGEPEYVNWDDCPKYVSTDLRSLLDNIDLYLTNKASVKVTLNIDISYEEASFLKDKFIEEYKIRELKLIPNRSEEEGYETTGDITFKSVDQIVSEQLENIESEKFDSKMLIDLYNKL
jgi:DNA repair exonuclease SbcCD nuclease subunit